MKCKSASLKTIGFIDYYLDEWHANHYPEWIREISKGTYTVSYAYAAIDSPLGGRSTTQWCQEMQIQQCQSMQELIGKCDFIIVLSPDHPQMHWPLCQEALRSGKRVYVDKTFAPTAQIARDLFALAEEYKTPMWSSSALRFSKERLALPDKEAEFVLLSGPGVAENYLIHQVEPMVCILKEKALRVQCNQTENAAHFIVEFASGKMGVMNLLGDGDFMTTIKYRDGQVTAFTGATEMFEELIRQILRFFETGYMPVSKEETIEIAAIIEAAHQAEKAPGTWVRLR